jgi:hypothetical protein
MENNFRDPLFFLFFFLITHLSCLCLPPLSRNKAAVVSEFGYAANNRSDQLKPTCNHSHTHPKPSK